MLRLVRERAAGQPDVLLELLPGVLILKRMKMMKIGRRVTVSLMFPYYKAIMAWVGR